MDKPLGDPSNLNHSQIVYDLFSMVSKYVQPSFSETYHVSIQKYMIYRVLWFMMVYGCSGVILLRFTPEKKSDF